MSGFVPNPAVYDSEDYLVLDFEVQVNDGRYGDARDPRNQLVYAAWKSGTGSGQLCGHEGNELEQEQLLKAVKKAAFLVAHNAKYELGWLRRMGVELEGVVVFDTMLAEYVLAGNLAAMDDTAGVRPVELNLDACCRRRGLTPKDAIVDIWIKNGHKVNDIPRRWVAQRCQMDVITTEQVFLSQRESLRRSNRLPVLYTRCLLTPVLVDVESQGMCLDIPRVLSEHTQATASLVKLEAALSELTGGINWRSSKQVGEYIYDKLKFKVLVDRRGNPKLTEGGKRATDADTLAALKATTDEQRAFLILRKACGKLSYSLSKNLDYFKHACETNNGLFYANFNQATTATNRLSSSGIPGPAGSVQLQNVPRAFKCLFRSREPDWVIMEIDGSGIEFRVAAFLGDDKQARKDLSDPGWDPHITSASEMYQVPYATLYAGWEEGDKKATGMRTSAKRHTFAPLYGKESGTKEEERWYKAFVERYSDLRKVQKGWVGKVSQHKKLVTPWGLTFYWPRASLNSRGYCNVQNSVYNYPIQALATAEIIPISLVYFWHATAELRHAGKCRIVTTVHDSVVVECPKSAVQQITDIALDSFGVSVYHYLKTVYGMNFDVVLGASLKSGEFLGEGAEESYNLLHNGQKVRIL